MEDNNINVSKVVLVEAIQYIMQQMNELIGSNHQIKLDYENERVIITKGIIFKTTITNKSFEEIIEEFLSREY